MKSQIQNLNKRTLIIIAVVMIAGIGTLLLWPGAPETEEVIKSLPVVGVTTAAEFNGRTSVSLIGTVRAFSEAAVTTEQAGRVTSVRTSLGQTVAAGQIIATLENASEQASVLQAEGSYEAALAAAAQNDVGTDEAQNQVLTARNNAVTTYKNAYGSINTTVLTTIDQFFAEPNSSVPGLRIDGRGLTGQLNNERIAYQSLLPIWAVNTGIISSNSDLLSELAYASEQTSRTISFLDSFNFVFTQQNNTSRYSEAELQGFIAEFSAARATLVNTQSAIDAATSQVVAAEEALERANLAASGSQNSAADAQVKQALGGLRAAQANLAKTVIRTPIAGTVNALSVRTGDFVGAQLQIAEVANNDALEIVTAIGEQERDLFAVGDQVVIESDLPGTVTEIAPAVDAGTGKIEVRIAAESTDLQNGDTVTISRNAATTVTNERVFVPLSAVKFEQTDGLVFLVIENKLEARPVELGVVRGGSVEVLAGLTPADTFVTDARGLQPGTEVEIIN